LRARDGRAARADGRRARATRARFFIKNLRYLLKSITFLNLFQEEKIYLAMWVFDVRGARVCFLCENTEEDCAGRAFFF